MHVERLQGIWSSDKGLKKMYDAAAMLEFANAAKVNARNTSKRGALDSRSQGREDREGEPADRPGARRDQAQTQRSEPLKRKQ